MKREVFRKLVLVAVLAMMIVFPVLVYAQPTTLTVLTGGDDEYIESTRRFFKEVERIYPDLRFEIQLGTLDNFVVQAAAGAPPDLVRLYGQNVPEYAAKGLLQDLTPFIDASPEIDIDDFVPVILHESLSYKGRIYSIPFGISITSLFFNKDRFDQAGTSYPDETWRWEVEGINEGKKMSQDLDGDGVPDRFFVTEVSGYNAYPFVYSAGGLLFSPDMTEFLGNSEANAVALEFVRDLADVHGIMPRPGQPGGPYDLLSEGTATQIVGSWFITMTQISQPSFAWDIAPLPTFQGALGTNVWPETPWAIPTGTPHTQEAWRALEFIGSVEGQRLATRLGLAGPPVRLSVAGSDFAREQPQVNVGALITLSTLPLTRPLPTAPNDARALYDQVISDVREGVTSARIALEDVAPRIQAILDDFLANAAL